MDFGSLIAAADRAVQVHLGGTPVLYQPLDGASVMVTGMFDSNYVLADQGNAGVEQTTPSVFLRLADLPLHPDDDDPTLTIAGTVYKVRERQTDGQPGGGIRLLLHRRES